jgi:hypothetical protein
MTDLDKLTKKFISENYFCNCTIDPLYELKGIQKVKLWHQGSVGTMPILRLPDNYLSVLQKNYVYSLCGEVINNLVIVSGIRYEPFSEKIKYFFKKKREVLKATHYMSHVKLAEILPGMPNTQIIPQVSIKDLEKTIKKE